MATARLEIWEFQQAAWIEVASAADHERICQHSLDVYQLTFMSTFGAIQVAATAEEPWELLPPCMEGRDALVAGNTAEFISQLPVHIDGSCNGHPPCS